MIEHNDGRTILTRALPARTDSLAAHPLVIQGGMGIGVSNWRLARAVSREGQLGVVSGTCIDSLFIRRLQDGDEGGHMRKAMNAFPIARVAEHALRKFYVEGGRDPDRPYALLPMWKETMSQWRIDLTVLASFAEVFLAKHGHNGMVGMNLLTKVQLPNLATLYGAMLADVDYVIMGAGIPKEIPGALDALARGDVARLRFDVEGADRNSHRELSFDPRTLFAVPPQLYRPQFLPVVSAHSLAAMLAKKSNGRVDGFVVEAPNAGGHNAPPRGTPEFNERGEPIYTERDTADFAQMRALNLPFWIAGGAATPDALTAALDEGATGVQVGTLFAFSDESGIEPGLKARAREAVLNGARVHTDPKASPTGFPFKVLELQDTNAMPLPYALRKRNCDLGYLRTAYVRPDGRTGYRCPSEPDVAFADKGGSADETVGRKCLCNALLANVGHAQVSIDAEERALLTSGDDLSSVVQMLSTCAHYTAADALDYLLGPRTASAATSTFGLGFAGTDAARGAK